MNTIELDEYRISFDESVITITAEDSTYTFSFIDYPHKRTVYNLLKYYKQVPTIKINITQEDDRLLLNIINPDLIHNDNITLYLKVQDKVSRLESQLHALMHEVSNLEGRLQILEIIESQSLMIQKLK